MDTPSFSRRTALMRLTSCFMKTNSSSVSVRRLRKRSSVFVRLLSLSMNRCSIFFKAFVHGGQDSDVLGSEAFLKPLVLGVEPSVDGVKARFELLVLSREAFVHGMENDGGLLGEEVFDTFGRVLLGAALFGFGLGHWRRA